MKTEFSQLPQNVTSYSTFIKKLETQLCNISARLNQRPKEGLPNNTVANPKSVDQQWLTIMTCNEKVIEGTQHIPMVEEGEKEVEEDEDAVSANNDDDLDVNEGGETLGSLESSEIEKVKNGATNAKRASTKNQL